MTRAISFQVLRSYPLTELEREQVAALVRDANREPWGLEPFDVAIPHEASTEVIACGRLCLVEAPASTAAPDLERLCVVLTELGSRLAGAEVRVHDSAGELGWRRDEARFAVGGNLERAPLIDALNGGMWYSAAAEVWTAPAALPPRVVRVMRDRDVLEAVDRRDPSLVGDALVAFATCEAESPTLRALLAACDPDAVTRAGLARYPELWRHPGARTALCDAMERCTDVASLARHFLRVWDHPETAHYYETFPLPEAFASQIAAVPEVRDRLVRDLDDVEAERSGDEVALARCARAALLLGASRDVIARRRLVEVVRRWRASSRSWHLRRPLYLPALEALGRYPHPCVVATLLLALDGSRGNTRAERWALIGAARVRPDRALPMISGALERGVAVAAALRGAEALGLLAGPIARAIEPYAGYPFERIRELACVALAACGRSAAEIARERARSASAEPTEHLLHADAEIRREAIEASLRRPDAAQFCSLAFAEALDVALRQRAGDAPAVYSWASWDAIAPASVLAMSPEDRLGWGRAHAASRLGPQRVAPALAALYDLPLVEAVTSHVAVKLRLGTATREELTRVEALLDVGSITSATPRPSCQAERAGPREAK